MSKKRAASILAFFLFIIPLFAQLSEEADVIVTDDAEVVSEEVVDNLITQHVKWHEVNRARQYEIEVQQKTADGWIETGIWVTEETEYDLRLEAGSYRFRLSAMNAVGKKGAPSGWAEFDVIDEAQPYLRSLPKSERYGVSAIERSIADEGGKETVAIRGAHCFGEDCSFMLEPCTDESLINAFRPFEKQAAVALPVVESDSSTGIVKLSFDWSRIVSGYYNLVVTTGSGLTDSLPVLMLPDRQPVLASKDTVYDDIMQAEYLDAVSGLTKLSFDVSALQQDSEYKLVPVSNSENEYPFETSYGRIGQAVSMNSYDDGVLSLSVNSSLLKSGWYDVVAATPGAEEGAQRIFVQTEAVYGSIPEVKSISTKFNTDRKSVTFTIKTKDAFFSEENENQLKLSIVSEKNGFGEFSRNILRQTSVSKNGTSAEFEIMASSVQRGINALMFETPDGMRLSFVKIASDYKAEAIDLSDLEIRECFLRAPTDNELSAREERYVMNGTEGIKLSEYLPAFQVPAGKWSYAHNGNFPASLEGDEAGLSFSVVNRVESTPYSSSYYLRDQDTVNMLRTSEGLSYQSMITSRNNGWTKWSLFVLTSKGNVEIPVPHDYRQLTQTVIIWKDYEIEPETISGLYFYVNARYPEESGWENTLEVYEAKTYSSLEPVEELHYERPHFLSKAGVLASYTYESDDYGSDESDDIVIPSYIYLNVFDTGWLSVNASFVQDGSHSMIGGEVTLAVPNDWFEPYVGMGMLYGRNARMEPLFAGVVMFKYINIRWTHLQKGTTMLRAGLAAPGSANADEVIWWSQNRIEAGIQIPLRKETVKFTDTSADAAEKKQPVFFTDLLFDVSTYIDWADETEELSTLPVFNFGVRLADLKFLTVDVKAGLHKLSVGDGFNFSAYDLASGLTLRLMDPLTELDITPFIGLDFGWLLSHDDSDNIRYLSPSVGFKIGKYVSFSLKGRLKESMWDKTWSHIGEAPLLAPITVFTDCNDLWLNLEISIPLRDK